MILSAFLLITLGSFQSVDGVNYAIHDQKSCESLGVFWELHGCQLNSLIINENDTFTITDNVVIISETLDNFGKIIIDKGILINAGGNVTNHNGGIIFNKEDSIVSNIGIFYNKGKIINESFGKIFNNDKGIFFNLKTGIIFNNPNASLINLGIFINKNIIFNERAIVNNAGYHSTKSIGFWLHSISGTNATDPLGYFINQDSGIIFNKQGTIFINQKLSKIINGDKGIFFIDTGSTIINLATIKNSDKFFIDCGGSMVGVGYFNGSIIEIPCHNNR